MVILISDSRDPTLDFKMVCCSRSFPPVQEWERHRSRFPGGPASVFFIVFQYVAK
jgi:hypothetical protein